MHVILQQRFALERAIRVVYVTDGDKTTLPQRSHSKEDCRLSARSKALGKIAAFISGWPLLLVLGIHPSDVQCPLGGACRDQGLTDLLLRDCNTKRSHRIASGSTIGHPETSLRLQSSHSPRHNALP